MSGCWIGRIDVKVHELSSLISTALLIVVVNLSLDQTAQIIDCRRLTNQRQYPSRLVCFIQNIQLNWSRWLVLNSP